MPPIRSLPPPAAPITPTPTRSPEAIAAQRAFFNAALGRAAPPVAAAPAPTPRAPSASAAPIAQFDPTAPPPDRPLRPGSLIDIKV